MRATLAQSNLGSYLMPSLEHATVADAAHPGILTCEQDASVTEVARMMASHHCHCIAVTGSAQDDSGDSLLWGIISDLDLLEAGLGTGLDASARLLAGQPVISVKPTMPLRDAAALMLTHHVAHMVVVEPATQRPVGILSSLDVAGVLAWGEA